MASSRLEEDLECSVGLNIYTDPVTLKCGPDFRKPLDTQEGSGGFYCPECREEFQEQPELHRNSTMSKTLEILQTTPGDQNKTGDLPKPCYHAPVPAVISCLRCDVFLCDNHLRVHSKSPEHVLCDPTTSQENRKYSSPEHVLCDPTTSPENKKCPSPEHVLCDPNTSPENRKCSSPEHVLCGPTTSQENKKCPSPEHVLCDPTTSPKNRKYSSPEHILCDPTTSPENRKCSVHNKILEYDCTEDSAFFNVSCNLARKHQRPKVETLKGASKKSNKRKKKKKNKKKKNKKKKKKKKKKKNHMIKTEDTEKNVQSLQESVTSEDLRRRFEDKKERDRNELSKLVERFVDFRLNRIQKVKDVHHIKELYNMLNRYTVLQEPDIGDLCHTEDGDDEESDTGDLCHTEDGDDEESDTGDLCDTEDGDDEDRERLDKLLHDGGGLDEAGVSHTGLSDITSGPHPQAGGPNIEALHQTLGVTDILLDVNTAGNRLHISDDRKVASFSFQSLNRPETPERFRSPQVLSSQSFSSGRHYWELSVRSEKWGVGLIYKNGHQSVIGNNKTSWSLEKWWQWENQYAVIHDSKHILIPGGISSSRIGIYLDYEAGQISFYELCNPIRHILNKQIRHLYTFTTTFTEPLHAALWVYYGSITLLQGKSAQGRVTCLGD